MKKIMMFLLLSSAIFARDLTLSQAIDLALDNSKEIKISNLNSEKAKYDVRIAFKKALPNVVYNANYNRHEYDTNMILHGKTVKRSGGYNQGITISQPIFMGGAIINGIKYATSYKNTANLNLLAQKRDIRLETIKIYSEIVKNKKNLEVLKSSKKDLDARHEKQISQLKMELITKADLLKTEYSILDLESKIIATNNMIAINKEKLKMKTGIDEDINIINFEVPENLSKNIDFESDVKNAQTKSINALISKEAEKMAQAQTSIARADMLPKISAFGTYGVAQDRRKFNESYEDATWRGGVRVTWDIFSFGETYDSYKKASLNHDAKVLEEEITTDNIKIALTDAYLNLIKIEKERASREKALAAARQNYKMDSQKYTAGIISTVDYLASQTNLEDAQTKYNDSTINYLYAFEKYRSLLV